MWKFLVGVALGNDTIRKAIIDSLCKLGDIVNDKYFTTPTETVNVGDKYEVVNDDERGNDGSLEKGVSNGC